MAKLTYIQWSELYVQYENTPDLSDSFGASGEHYILVSILNKLGYYPHSREEAMELAEQLLAEGYDE